MPTPTTPDAKGPSPNHDGTTAEWAAKLLPTPDASVSNDGEDPDQWEARRQHHAQRLGNNGMGTPLTQAIHRFGDYTAAIHHWATIHGPPPPPTIDNRLNPAFAEWMLGHPPGLTSGLTRRAALQALGNSVQPQQAAHALQLLDPQPA